MRLLLLKILLLCIFVSPSNSSDLDAKLKNLEALETQIPDKQTIHNTKQTAQLKASLGQIIDEALKQQKLAENNVTKTKDLLNSLKVEGSADTEIQDATVLKQKAQLENELQKYTAQLKKARLIEAQAKEIQLRISNISAATFSDFIFKKSPSPILPTSIGNAYTEWKSAKTNLTTVGIIKYLALLLVGNFILLFFGKHIYAYYKKSSNKTPIEEGVKYNFYARPIAIIFSTIVTAYSAYYALGTEEASPFLVNSILFICYIIAIPFLYYLIGKVNTSPIKEIVDGETVTKERNFFRLVVFLAKAALTIATVSLVMGYVILGSYITFNIALTSSAICIFLLLRVLAEKAICYFKTEENATLSSLSIMFVEVILGVALFAFVTNFWGFSPQNYADLYNKYKNGVDVGGTKLRFDSIIFAIIGFFVIIYVFKFLQWFFKERVLKNTHTKQGAADAMTSLLGYLGVAIALVTALSMLGLKSEDLAIVVGALSLGIGFGLQNIINNFVSGLILLFERPVKIGDWIVLDNGLEGNIKKIRIRSTELQTFQRASVVIPNSDLISKSITNWTLRDPIGRIEIPIGVAYGSNTEKVKELLLQIVNEMPQIRKLPMPRVLFRNFGDSSLDFELRCFAKNIDERLNIESEIRFAIDATFRKNNIEIPFPQRDVNIKNTSNE